MIERFFLFVLCAFFCFACGNEKKTGNQINVFCAASLSNVLVDIKSEWEKTHGEKIVLNLASSGTLARQIEYGAEADIFLSANHQWMEYVQETTKKSSNAITIARNRMVIVTGIENEFDSTDFESVIQLMLQLNDKIAAGDPGHVPLGRYTKSALEKNGLYENLSDRIILAKDARSTLRLVELGEASFGFVYMTDATASEKVKVIAIVPNKLHEEIRYEATLINDQSVEANSFLQFLTSPEASPFWIRHGFIF